MMRLNNFKGLKQATRDDKPAIVGILKSAFQKDPGLAWMLELSKNKNKLGIILDYVVEETFDRGTIYLTDDKLGVALWHGQEQKKFSFRGLKRNLQLALKLNFATIARLLKFQHITHKHFPKGSDYRYLVNIAVMPEAQGNGLANKLIVPVVEACAQNGTPVFLETANMRNVEIYQKKGFRLTDTVNFKAVSFHYMKYTA